MTKRDLAIPCHELDCERLLVNWQWLVPGGMQPLMIGIFGDWIFGASDASHWHLDLLGGRFHKVANDSNDFNAKKRQEVNRDEWFGENWANIALGCDLVPDHDECLGWAIAPILGGPFSVENIQVFPLPVYQRVTASLLRQIAEG